MIDMVKRLSLALLLISPTVLTTQSANASDFYDTETLTEQGETWAQLGIGSLITSAAVAGSYNRDSFFFESYKPNTSIGFYTNQSCDFINIDHVVSLKDAYDSGAASWSAYKKRTFANDKANHVPSCGRVNSSKGSAGPRDFLRRSNDGKGLEYEIVRFCEYVQRYYAVKVEYGLSFDANGTAIFEQCGVSIS
ncbi:HNH endonuclease family protein [Porticoccaceae bacterium]|nr:HNH endonuclease family protein [Porticoccaceae bacterium]